MQSNPAGPHNWLKSFIGEWSYEGECVTGPGQDPMKFVGTEVVRAVGELWIVGESRGVVPGGDEATMVLTVGYDPRKGKFVASWIGSMAAHLWVYEGWLDDTGRVLTLEAEGYSFAEPDKLTRFRDITEFLSDDERRLTAVMRSPSGEWAEILTTVYRRSR